MLESLSILETTVLNSRSMCPGLVKRNVAVFRMVHGTKPPKVQGGIAGRAINTQTDERCPRLKTVLFWGRNKDSIKLAAVST